MKRNWYRLDNAALIFPAIMRRGWSNAFRVSITLKDEIDSKILAQAVEDLRKDYPTFFVRLRSGFFWYYLEEQPKPIKPIPDFAYPLTNMNRKELSRCCVRVLYYGSRIAVECFHSVTDGSGGMRFLKSLVARYLFLKDGIKADIQPPDPQTFEDAFPKCAYKHAREPRWEKVYRIKAKPEPNGYLNLITGMIPTDKLVQAAHSHGVTVTSFLAAVMAISIQKVQAAQRAENRWKPVMVSIPVNLRKVFGVDTMRNFSLAANVGFHPWEGHDLDTLCKSIQHQLAIQATPQVMGGMVANNVQPAKNKLVRSFPLVIKNPVMRMFYNMRGESTGCINISNLGRVELPQEMESAVDEVEFIIGVQSSYPNNCSVASFGGRTMVNMIRRCRRPDLEREFFSLLVEEGVPVEIRSNRRR